jgi:hypothetical protein
MAFREGTCPPAPRQRRTRHAINFGRNLRKTLASPQSRTSTPPGPEICANMVFKVLACLRGTDAWVPGPVVVSPGSSVNWLAMG